MDEYRNVLQLQEAKHAPSLLKKHGIICKQMQYGNDSESLYLGKPNWTNRFDNDRETTIGIFCCIWVSTKLLKSNQFAYNIHSKKLKSLPGYTLTPTRFASDFRTLVKSPVAKWPNIRLDYGPSTLLEGRESSDIDKFADNVRKRIDGFVKIQHHIDDLLEAAKSS